MDANTLSFLNRLQRGGEALGIFLAGVYFTLHGDSSIGVIAMGVGASGMGFSGLAPGSAFGSPTSGT